MKKAYVITFLTILIVINLLVIAHFIIKNSSQPHSSTEDPTQECHKKNIVWDKNEYEISSGGNENRFFLKLEEKQLDKVNYLLKPASDVQSSSTEYCMAGLVKVPLYENMPVDLKKEIQKNKKGLAVSLMEKNSSTTIATFTMNIQVFAKRESEENYNFDKAFEEIVRNYQVEKENDTIQITLKGRYETNSFTSDIVEYEKERIIEKDLLIISTDGGKTWNVEVIQNVPTTSIKA